MCLSLVAFWSWPGHSVHDLLAAIVNFLSLATLAVYGYRDLLPLATYYLTPADEMLGPFTWIRIGLLGWTALIVPGFLPRRHVPVDPKNPLPATPEQTASIISSLLYSYMDPLIAKASKRSHLSIDELPPLADVDHSRYLRDQTFPELDPTIRKSQRHIFFAFLKIYAKSWFTLTITVVLDCLNGFIAPVATYQLLHYVETSGQGAFWKPWVWLVLILARSLLGAIAAHWYQYEIAVIGVRTEGIITQLLFEHALRIRVNEDVKSGATDGPTPASVVTGKTASSSTSTNMPKSAAKAKLDSATSTLVGRINNLISSDLEHIVEGRELPYILIHIPLKIILSMWFLYLILGWSTFVGMALMLAGSFLPSGKITALMHNAQIQKMKKTDKRVQVVTETVGLLRLVKMFGWEKRMQDRLRNCRGEELSWLKTYNYYWLVHGIITWNLALLSLIGTYATYTVIMKQPLSGRLFIFSSLGVLESLRQAMFDLLHRVPSIVKAKVSIDRTELLDAYPSAMTTSMPLSTDPAVVATRNKTGFGHAHFTWSAGSAQSGTSTARRGFTLRIDGEIDFAPGSLTLITGPTGSGKSSLLLALLGELHYLPSGVSSWFNLPRDGGVSYCAQEPWILNETIKDNILFGRAYEEARYKQVLHECALERDLEMFDAGDETEVTQASVTLKPFLIIARVSLARAVYSESSIVLLDDILSALDVHTIKWVVNKCLQGDILHRRTIILVTNNLSMTRRLAHRVVTLTPNGSASINILLDPETMEEPDSMDREALPLDRVDEPKPEAKDTIIGDGKLVTAEEVAVGQISRSAIRVWFPLTVMAGSVDLLNLCASSQTPLEPIPKYVIRFLTWWLGTWGRMYDILPPEQVNAPFYLGVYCLFVVLSILSFSTRQLILINAVMRSAKIIHQQLAAAILGTTFRFLDKTPVGRILQRFTKDIGSIDASLPTKLYNLLMVTIIIVLRFVVVISFAPHFVLPSLVLAALGLILGRYYIHAQLPVKREMSNARAPIFTVFGDAVHGLATIRAYGVQARFAAGSLSRIDNYTRAARPFWNLNRWIGLRIDYLGGMYSAVLAGYLIYVIDADATQIGFLLNVSLFTSELLMNWWAIIIMRSDLESLKASQCLERIQHYLDIEQEQAASIHGLPPASWPTSGELSINKLSARYSVDGPKVLHDLNFTVRSGEKIGVVGRTGSGKSSLTLGLLRLIITDGEVYFDGLPTSALNLENLRGAITIIPQQPELMSGTVRSNLDPFGEHEDATLNGALRAAGLFSLQESLRDEERISLDTNINSSGANFSVGQRQILALARALVRRSRVLILDEATASMDYQTDNLIQESLRTQFRDCTVITVAHRLHTIMDADRVLVLDQGRLVEYDSPQVLLAK
ncbi:P-loop containing nucleoside triphosphate hydrolase protein, partial [Clavulina sp. PMI_390]